MHLIHTFGYALLRPVDLVVMHLSLKLEVWDLNRASQIENSVPSSFLLLRHFFEGRLLGAIML